MLCCFDSNQQYIDDMCFGWFQYFHVCWDMKMMFMWFKIWLWKYDLCFDEFLCITGLRYKLCDLCWENDPLKCLCFMRKLCIESMIMKVNIWWFEHEAWAWIWVKCIRYLRIEGKPSMLWMEWMILWMTSLWKEWVTSSHYL
jgi:hypothetical protein